jgi:sulfate adenylyltransferase large subunit
MNVLRLITAGSVDDGKSTLIGRLLYDAKLIADDHLTSITQTSAKRGYEGVNLALLTDGLRAEREQGITIDVAYRYFQTPKRKFILADTPGHVQYTRNMVTAASNADVAIILIDARRGVTEQTRRHTILAKLLGIRAIIVCVNKMDLVSYSESVFRSIMREHEGLFAAPNEVNRHYIPISALNGDNLIRQSPILSWYEGRTLLETLEGVENTASSNAGGA